VKNPRGKKYSLPGLIVQKNTLNYRFFIKQMQKNTKIKVTPGFDKFPQQ
jgi:hypothetical protein